jgi:hypothetical protein
VLRSGVEQGFETAGRTVEKQRADRCSRGRHRLRLHGEGRRDEIRNEKSEC